MGIILEISTRDYDGDIILIKKALSHMETLLGCRNGYSAGGPTSRFGWTFFRLAFGDRMRGGMEGRFSDMISRYGGGPAGGFAMFVADYLNSKGCSVRASVSEQA